MYMILHLMFFGFAAFHRGNNKRKTQGSVITIEMKQISI